MKKIGFKKLLFTTIAVFAIWLLANFLVETKDTNAGRQPGDFLNQDFWDNYSSNWNLIAALYGDWTPGSSPYSRFWTWWCNITSVVYLNTSTYIPWATVQPNTIYVLDSGVYELNGTETINMQNCSAIVGKWDVTITNNWNMNNITVSNKQNIIIDNLILEWTGSTNWINMYNSSQNTINNVEVWWARKWILLENSNHNTLNKIKSHDNVNFGIQLFGASNNYINNSQVYNNKDGVHLAGTNSYLFGLSNSNNNIINNSLIFNNDHWISITVEGGNNGNDWHYTPTPESCNLLVTIQVYTWNASYNTINNSLIFNNQDGVYAKWGNGWDWWDADMVCNGFKGKNWGKIINNIINNSILFNNQDGITIEWWDGGDGWDWAFTWNWWDGGDGWDVTILTNNISMYNSSNSIIAENWTSWTEWNNLSGYGGDGWHIWDWKIFYYGHLKIFDITNNTVVCDINTGTSAATGLSWNDWTLDTQDEYISYYWFVNPVNSIWNKLLNGTDWNTMRGTGTFFANEPTKYIFGKNIIKQVLPVKYNLSTTELENFWEQGKDRDPNEYIAAVNMELNPTDEQIVNYYYGPNSEFTTNWNENNCSLWAFTVEYVNNSNITSKLLDSGVPLGHTIYVIQDDDYNLWTATIDIADNCVAIVNQWSGAIIKRSWSSINPLIKVNWQENIILDWLNIDGQWVAEHGIVLEKVGSEWSNNNTINNIKSYKNTKNGIMLWVSASYNTIMNTQTWNNQQNGIEIYLGGQYNIINNSLSYNNNKYGIRFGNISKYNTINNGQFFNNNNGGIFADFTTEQNIINNVHTYNNAGYGINFKRSSGNSLHNVYSYHNNVWINMTDISCVNNQFNWELMLFGNSLEDMIWTDGDDEYLKPWLPLTFWSEWRVSGTLETGDDSMSCAFATNPTTNLTNGRLLNIWSGCIDTWVQSSWSRTNPNSIDYMFGLWISKQIKPVGYTGWIISLLDSQYNASAYIWEKNPIIWTHPGSIYLLSGNETDLALNTNHEMNVSYNTGMINHNFDVVLTLYPSTTNGHIQIKTAGTWNNIWTGMTGVDFSTIQWMRIVVTTPNDNYKNVSGTLYIGTDQYWYNTWYFDIRTIADQTPPTITWNDNISNAGLWKWQSDTWQATVSGVYATSGWASYVTGASQCHSGIAIPTNAYNNTIQDISAHPSYDTFNNKYICILAKDNVNNHYKTWLSNKIRISKLEFVDDIDSGSVYYDTIDINFQNLQNYGYKRVNTTWECATWLSMIDMIDYTGPIVISNDISLNGKYLCAYGEDGTGSGKYLASSHNLDIIDYSSTVNFIDDVSPNWVSSERVEVYFLSTIVFSQKKYKWVDNMTDCNNSVGMVDYTGAITIDHQWLNQKHFCLYSKEDVSGIENYLISTNKVRVDTTNPTTPTIVSPTSGQNVYWLVIETLWADDADSGLAGFEYEIAENQTFLDVISDGIYYTTGTQIVPNFDENVNQTFAIRVRAVDAVWNVSDRSSSVEFDYQELDNFEFENIEDAEAGEIYMSNEIIMAGLDTNETILAEVTYGVLYRNGEMKWTSGLVQNDDELQIEMFASEDYDEETETELIIANRSIPWTITTIDEDNINNIDCDLSNSQMLSIASMFNSILNMYQGSQLTSFLITMQSMLEDNIALISDEDSICNMQHMLSLIEDELDGTSNPTNTHIAPNCKEYNIDYSNSKQAYYSPDMIVRTYFGSRDELGKYLDSKNPGDCHINTYGNTVSYDNTDPDRHIAPNGKVYDIDFSQIGYTSPDFSYVKYFASLTELRNYIDRNNPAVLVWDHDVDSEFTPVIHSAPNGKTYKIYKTNRWFMSYKLLNVRYYSSLEELQNYIDRNNQ